MRVSIYLKSILQVFYKDFNGGNAKIYTLTIPHKTLPEFAAKTASCVFEPLKYKEVVPAILVPLQEALDEAKAQSTGKQNYVDMVFRVGETGAR